METTDIIIDYSPYIIATLVFLLRNKIFVTPEQLQNILSKFKEDSNSECSKIFVTKEEMQKERKSLFHEVEQKFLSIFVFREFEKRIEDHFKMNGEQLQKIDENVRFLIESREK